MDEDEAKAAERISVTAAYSCSCGTRLVHGQHKSHPPQFYGYNGSACLFTEAENIREATPELRNMTTGVHQVADIFCSGCNTLLGWKYISAAEPSQKYKEGKYLIALALLNEISM